MSEGHAVEGYDTCACGNWVLKVVATHTGGRCEECFAADGATMKVELVSAGSRQSIPRRSRRPAPKRPGSSKGRKVTARASEHARRRALTRLRALHPDEYDLLYAQERARAGLPALTVEMALRERSHETIDFDGVYHALADAGVDVDESPS